MACGLRRAGQALWPKAPAQGKRRFRHLIKYYIPRARARGIRLVTYLNVRTTKAGEKGMYKGKTFMRMQKVRCGEYLEVDIYPVFQRPGVRRSRSKPTRAVQKRLNQKNAERKLMRLLRLNFSSADVALHLTYGTPPATEEEGARDLRNFLRRVKRLRQKQGLGEMRYITHTERGEKSGRIHHHVILTGGIDRDTLEQLWGKGYANTKRLRAQEDGLRSLSKYLCKTPLFFKRYSTSRNLRRPQPQTEDGIISIGDARCLAQEIMTGAGHSWLDSLYPGWEVTALEASENTVNGGVYIQIELRQKQKSRRETCIGLKRASA